MPRLYRLPLIALLSASAGTVLGQAMSLPSVGATSTESLGQQPLSTGTSIGSGGDTGTRGEGRRAWSVVPRVTVTETISDNVAIGSANKRSDQITEISPGVRVEANTARLRLHLDYSLRGQYYAQSSTSNTQNSLNAFGTLEAIENTLFVDMSGVIAQQSISAFGPQSTGAYSVNANSTETSNFRISPFLRGHLGSFANYEARYAHSTMRAKSALASDTDIDEFMARINGNTPLAALGWALDASAQKYDYSTGRTTEADRWRGFLTYRFHPQFKVSVSAGSERNDYMALTKQSWNTHGYGFDWLPTERTQVSAFREKRFFGNGHNVTMMHRLPRSAIRYTDSRDISALPNQLTTVGLGSIFSLLDFQLQSSIPNPVQRAAFINALLAANGIAPNTQIVAGFLSSQVSVSRRQELSWVLQGVRNMLMVGLVRSQNDQMGSALLPQNSITSSVGQKGINVGWSHQLSALTSLNVTGTQMRSDGTGTTFGGQYLKQKSFSAGLTTKLGARTSGMLTARHTKADSTTSPYSENAVIGSVAIQF